jgi:hypothetical protein
MLSQHAALARGPRNLIYWRDILVLVDNGATKAAEYAHLGAIILDQRSKYTHPIGLLTVIPRDQKPPPEEVRRAINKELDGVQDSLKCLSYVVEGTGFPAAIARAVLTGLRLIRPRPYASRIATGLEEALAWTLVQLGGEGRLSEAESALEHIRHERATREL